MKKEVFLEGKRIYLRSLKKEDIRGNYARWLNDHEVCRFNNHGYFPATAKELEKYVDRVNSDNSILVLAIVSKRGNVHIGNIAFRYIDWISRSAEFAIIIGEKKFWGKGIAKEAADLILRHGFNELNLHRIYCGTSEDNIPMRSLAAYLGMKKEGLRRQAFFKNEKYRNIIEYGILRHEYSKMSES